MDASGLIVLALVLVAVGLLVAAEVNSRRNARRQPKEASPEPQQ